MDKKAQINFWFIIVAILSLLLIQNLYTQYTHVKPIPYSRFQHLLEQGSVAEIVLPSIRFLERSRKNMPMDLRIL